jgi:hypothetical protein
MPTISGTPSNSPSQGAGSGSGGSAADDDDVKTWKIVAIALGAVLAVAVLAVLCTCGSFYAMFSATTRSGRPVRETREVYGGGNFEQEQRLVSGGEAAQQSSRRAFVQAELL